MSTDVLKVYDERRAAFRNKKKKKKEKAQKRLVQLAKANPTIKNEVARELLSQGFLNEALARKKTTKRAGDFYRSHEWKAARYAALIFARGRCACCGARAADGAVMHVDHKKPRSKFPELALEPSNLQVLCDMCNVAKSNIDMSEWDVVAQDGDDGTAYRKYAEEERKIFRLVRDIASDKK